MIEAHFGSRPPFTLGVEEELIIVDAETLDQVAAVDKLIAGTESLALPGRVKTELHASVFETNTDPCATADEALAALVDLRRGCAAVAAEAGLAIAGVGSHPFAVPEGQPIVKEERYVAMVGYHGLAARRQNVQGVHVHLAMADAESCWRALEGMLPWLPVILAISANSPWLDGELTGMLSNRAPILAELPRTAGPPAFASYAEWEAWVERLMRVGVLPDYTRIWWDIRPHPKLGTLEIRVPDQPTDVRRSGAFAALLQALAATVLAGDVHGGGSWRLPPQPLVGGALRPGGGADRSGRRAGRARVGARDRALRADRAGGGELRLVGPPRRARRLHLRGLRAAVLLRSARGHGGSRHPFASLTPWL